MDRVAIDFTWVVLYPFLLAISTRSFFKDRSSWLTHMPLAALIGAPVLLATYQTFGQSPLTRFLHRPRTLEQKAEQCDFAFQYTEFESFSLYIKREGQYVSKDFKEAFQWCVLAANSGSPIAQASIGSLYYLGRGVKKDYGEAEKWWRKAAQNGDPQAQSNLANMYQRGLNFIPQNYSLAFYWYQKSAEQGYGPAEFGLANLYVAGQGTKQDYEEAAKWYRKAAEQPGQSDAMGRLGLLYANGLGVKQDWQEAFFWLDIASPTVRYLDKDVAETESAAKSEAMKHLTPDQVSEIYKRIREWPLNKNRQ